jgi:predicted lipid-binding transport protein (Tim44 family)
MKRVILILTALCSAALLISEDADAKRLGGGRSFGTPRDTVTQRQATPPAATPTPAQPAAPASAAVPKATPTPMTPPVQQPAWKRWMGPIAGIAAGLGIAALMSHLGLSEAFGHFLLIALFVVAAIVILRLLFRRSKPEEGIQYRGTQLAGAGAAGGQREPTAMFGGAGPAAVAEGASPPAKPYPEGFDPAPFLQQAKANFVKLQRAYDDGDASTLRDVMTPEMFAEVSKDLASRGVHHATEVVTLNAEILEVTTERDGHWASVRFTGLLREDNAPTPAPFDEVWNLTKPLSGETGWLLAGIQQLQ